MISSMMISDVHHSLLRSTPTPVSVEIHDDEGSVYYNNVFCMCMTGVGVCLAGSVGAVVECLTCGIG